MECVALHRYHNDHIPACLHGILDEKLKALVAVTEMTASKKMAHLLSIDIMLMNKIN